MVLAKSIIAEFVSDRWSVQFADLFLSVYVCLCVFDYRITRQLCCGEYASLVENGKEEEAACAIYQRWPFYHFRASAASAAAVIVVVFFGMPSLPAPKLTFSVCWLSDKAEEYRQG